MLIAANILLFCSLAWPFLAGTVVAALVGRAGEGGESAQRQSQLAPNLSLVGLALMAFDIPCAWWLETHGFATQQGWMTESSLAVTGAVVLHASLVSRCFAPPRREDAGALLSRDAVPFWTTGLLVLALMLSAPVARAAMLLSAPVLAVILLDTGAGRALVGWNMLRRNVTGTLLALTGLLHPNPTVSGLLTGFGMMLVSGLWPACLPSRSSPMLERVNSGEALRLAAAALITGSLLTAAPQSMEAAQAFSILMIVAGFLTVATASLRLRVVSGEKAASLTLVSIGLAAIAVGIGEALLVDLVLFGPLLAGPWRDMKGRGQWKVAGLLGLPVFGATLLIVMVLSAIWPTVGLVLVLALTPAWKPVLRFLPSFHARIGSETSG
ncbi:hypothetical protein [Acetobacter estunensis]|uniref:hypothetical protein n=1 Tax=Acetobacter estunensis TaxID=104097 RepID=UPI001C2D705B|nr:hypothetical protein [Acetobacter estunensis]MBV1838322.1 hypothetical protein [Acetobacter estunensis]